jgi:hypothetical protein
LSADQLLQASHLSFGGRNSPTCVFLWHTYRRLHKIVASDIEIFLCNVYCHSFPINPPLFLSSCSWCFPWFTHILHSLNNTEQKTIPYKAVEANKQKRLKPYKAVNERKWQCVTSTGTVGGPTGSASRCIIRLQEALYG